MMSVLMTRGNEDIGCAETQREDGHLPAKEKGLEQIFPHGLREELTS